MGIRDDASHLCARHDQFKVGTGLDTLLLNRLGEAWPPGARIEFIVRRKQGFTTDNIHIDALTLFIVIGIAEGVVRCLLFA